MSASTSDLNAIIQQDTVSLFESSSSSVGSFSSSRIIENEELEKENIAPLVLQELGKIISPKSSSNNNVLLGADALTKAELCDSQKVKQEARKRQQPFSPLTNQQQVQTRLNFSSPNSVSTQQNKAYKQQKKVVAWNEPIAQVKQITPIKETPAYEEEAHENTQLYHNDTEDEEEDEESYNSSDDENYNAQQDINNTSTIEEKVTPPPTSSTMMTITEKIAMLSQIVSQTTMELKNVKVELENSKLEQEALKSHYNKAIDHIKSRNAIENSTLREQIASLLEQNKHLKQQALQLQADKEQLAKQICEDHLQHEQEESCITSTMSVQTSPIKIQSPSSAASKAGSVRKMMTCKFTCQSLKDELLQLKDQVLQLPQQLEQEMKQISSNYNTMLNNQFTSLNHMRESEIRALQLNFQSLQDKYNAELVTRKELQNQLMEERGNIRIHCRLRPTLGEEQTTSLLQVMDFETINGQIKSGAKPRQFLVDEIHAQQSTQDEVFTQAKSLLPSLLDGYNVCFIAYGQTGSGKTYTMEGTNEQPGVMMRSLEEVFQLMKSKKELFSYTLKMHMVEIYNNELRDLLALQKPLQDKKLEVFDLGEDKGLNIPNLTRVSIQTLAQCLKYIKVGVAQRAEAATLMNSHSSRSHLVVTLEIESRLRENLNNSSITNGNANLAIQGVKSKLRFVDLAGSENANMSGSHGETLREASFVNKSLAALGDVMSALSQKQKHIPYRNSRLTHYLQDSLGGDAKMLVFVTISPTERCISETLNTLSFAQRIRQVKRGKAKQNVITSNTITSKKQ